MPPRDPRALVPQSAPKPPPAPSKAATVWAAEQTYGTQPWLTPPPRAVPKPPTRPIVVTKAPPPPPPMPLNLRYALAKAAPVSPVARRMLLDTMTPQRKAAIAQSMTPQLPAPKQPGFFSDPLGLHLWGGVPGGVAAAVRGVPSTVAPLGRDAAALATALYREPAFSRKYAAQDVGVAKLLGKGIARETQGLVAKASQYGTLSATGQPMGNVEAQKEASAMPVQPQVFANLAAEGLGGVAIHGQHPLYALGKDFQYAHSVFNGTTQLGGLLTQLPQMSPQERNTALAGVLDSASAAFHKFSNLTVQQAFAKGQQDPMNGIINAVSVFDPAFKGVEALKMGTLPILARNLRAGFSISDSLDHVQQLRLRGPGGEMTVEKPLPRGYIARQGARAGYRVSRAIDPLAVDRPFVRRFGETGRAARQLTRLRHETMTRDMAKAASIYRDIRKVTRGRFGQHLSDQEIRLVLEHQMSQGHSYEEGLQAVAEDMRQMLAGRKFETPGGKESPGLARARSRVERFSADAERANQRQRSRSVVGISKEQVRLTDSLAKTTAAREDVRAEMRRINADTTLTDEERSAQLATQQQKLRALDGQSKDTRQQLDLISVDQPPIQSAERSKFIEVLREHPNFDEEQIQAYLTIGDSAARALAQRTGEDPAAWWDKREFLHTPAEEVPDAAYAQVSEPYQVFDPKKVSGRLKSKLNPRYADRGVPANPRTRQLARHIPEGSPEDIARITGQQGLHVLGPITPEAWVKRVLHVMPTLAERQHMAHWYEAVQPLFDHIFGKDSDRVLRAFAVSQANASPTSGLQAVLKVADKLKRGEPIGKREISTVVKSIEAAYTGQPVTSGVAAKLSDFIDSLIGTGTRTWMGHDLAGGAPAAIDIHALRDLGFVDAKLVRRLEKRGLVRGQDFVVDGKGVATGPLYERASEKYQQITDHLNKIGFDGRKDWEPRQVQALGWSAIQKFHGTDPEDLAYAIERSTQRIQAPGATARDIRNVVRDEGGYVTRSGKGWADGVMTEQMADRITQRLADDHGEARAHWLSNKSKARRPLLRIEGRVAPKLVRGLEDAGFTHVYRAGGETIFRADGKVVPKKLAATLEEHKPNVVFNGKVQENVRYGERAAAPVGPDYHRPVDANLGVPRGPGGLRPRPDVRFAEGTGPREFLDAAARNPRQDFLTPHTPETLAEHRLFLSEDGHTGYALSPEGDLQNVFRNPDGIPGSGLTAVDHAVENGAKTLDAFDGTLPTMYKDAGFNETGRMAWDDQYAPDNWDYEAHGRPDVVFMGHGAEERANNYFGSWDEAKAHSLAQVPSGPPAARFMAQSRKGDLLGGVHFLEGPGGKRIIYLTEHANASTVLHEMVGHAADEMKRYYPQEFAPVEEAIGKPFAQWTVADHETFARWTERYFLEGHAPTPELVDAFGRIKAWMRAVYAGVKQRLGGRLNPQMRNLLDTYLGGYDDPGAARIGMFFGEERAFSEAQAARGVAAQARSEMERLQKAQSTRAFNKSVKGMQQRLDTLMKQTTLSEAEQLEAEHLGEKVLWAEANDAARAWKREQNLKQKLGDIETALSKPGDTPEHQAAREALAWFSDDRERILRDVFGDQFDEMFANRNDLLSDWLVGHNLIEPDFTTGTAHYFPATVKNPTLRSKIGNVHAALTSRVIGKMKTDRLTLYKRNNMTLWQRGDWNADPVVLVEAHQRAQGFAYMNEMKGILYGLGRDLTLGEAQGLQPLDDVVFVNLHGTPIGTNLRAAIDEVQTGSKTHDVQNFLDGVEGGDNEAAMSSLDRYQQSILLDPKEVLPEGLSMQDVVKLAHDPNGPIRVLPRSMVEMLTPPIRGSSTAPGRALDFGMTLARWALIYANAPGYMLVNGIGNFGYLLAQQSPFRVPWMIANMYRLTRNRALFDRIGGETGELPLLASIARGRGAGKMTRVYGAEQAALSKISAVDRYPRALAWMYEAAKRGYKSDAEMTQLLDSNAAKAVKDRMVIGDLARNHMVDFDRLTPFERNTVTRALFVYPWVRGATAWPFWFAKQYPVRTAALAAVSQNLEQRREKMLGPTPPWYEGLFPISTSKGGRRANVANAAPYSPTATALSSLEMLHDVVASALGQKGNNTTAHLVDMLAPQWRTAIEGSTGVNQFGKNVTLLDVLKGAFPSMIPGYRLANAMVNPDTAPKIYTNVSRAQQFERTFLRITPSDISIPRLNAQAPPNVPTVSEQIATETTQGKKYLAKLAPDMHWDSTMQHSTVIRVTYEAQKTAMQRAASKNRQWDPKKLSTGGYEKTPALTPLADAHLIYTVVKHFLPGLPPTHLPEPEALLRALNADAGTPNKYTPTNFLGKQVLIRYRNDTYNQFAGSVQQIITQGKQLQEARRAGLAH